MTENILDWYQWNFRPQDVRRPEWFDSWPEGARVAVTVKLMHEWESVPRPAGRRGMPSDSRFTQDYRALCRREYGFKAGVWRLMDVLDKHGVKATVMASGLSAELWPDSLSELKTRGHEIASHGWDQAIHPPKFESRDQEREALLKSIASIENTTGERPYGYMSQGPRPTDNTLEIVAEAGFVWNGDYQDSDIPYVMQVNGKKVVSVGYVRPTFTDNDIEPYGLVAGLQELKGEFDAVYEESAIHPMKFVYAVHSHVSGRPGMAKLLDNFLQYAAGHDGVWFCRCIDMANYWLDNEGH